MKPPSKLDDLFAPILERADFHPYFARVFDHGAPVEKAVVNAWAEGFPDRDGKFVKEFQGSFNSSFWELYLHAALRTSGFGIDCTHDRPDFLISGECGDLALEAVVALNPDEYAPDWARHASPRGLDFERLLDLASLRLAQSVQSKSDKWLKSYSTLPHCMDRGLIICVAPFEQPFGQLQGTQAIARVLFGEVHDLVLQNGQRSLRVGETTQSETFKPSGSPIKLGLFRDPSLAHVSGVLFSSLATWSKVSALADDDGRMFEFHAIRRVGHEIRSETSSKPDYRETLLDGLHLFLKSLRLATTICRAMASRWRWRASTRRPRSSSGLGRPGRDASDATVRPIRRPGYRVVRRRYAQRLRLCPA